MLFQRYEGMVNNNSDAIDLLGIARIQNLLKTLADLGDYSQYFNWRFCGKRRESAIALAPSAQSHVDGW